MTSCDAKYGKEKKMRIGHNIVSTRERRIRENVRRHVKPQKKWIMKYGSLLVIASANRAGSFVSVGVK
jgi:hypothetical protein